MGLKEQGYPKDASGKSDLRYYADPVEHYVAMYDRFLNGEVADPKLAFPTRVHATWGLIAKGVEAVPHAVRMLGHRDPDAREDGAAILAELGSQPEAVDSLLTALKRETEVEARDSMIQALGRMRAREAIPLLRDTILSEATDGDTRHTAIEALGRIVRKRFLAAPDPGAAAREWLDRQQK
jgi:HEAT repeat protein